MWLTDEGFLVFGQPTRTHGWPSPPATLLPGHRPEPAERAAGSSLVAHVVDEMGCSSEIT